MKIAFLLLALSALLVSCSHTDHSYSTEWIYDDVAHMRVCESADCNETIAYAKHEFINTADGKTCSVCGYKSLDSADQAEHTHSLSIEYTLDSANHWLECLTCGERVNISNHVFGDISVTVPPTSDSEGVGEKYCSICGKISRVSIDRLSEKMSEDEWKACFSLSNVRIRESSKNGSLTASDTVYESDGNIVAKISSLGTTYYGKHILSMIDFSEYYDNFSSYGEGVYRSSGFEIVTLNGKMNIRDVEIRTENSLLTHVSYCINLGAFGTISYTYVLYDYGDVTLSPTYLSKKDIEVALDVKNLQNGVTLAYARYDASGKSTEAQLTIQDSGYLCKKYQGGTPTSLSRGDAELAATGLGSHLICAFAGIGEVDMVYEDIYDSYTYIGEGVELYGIGLATAIDITISDNLILCINIQLADGTTVYYEFQYT